ncbi:MAG: tetratricopeptide repeat protein [Verrucomicrobia bacterium]|nr:MAG: tetratricopeptide repeat protein [Verrucomicrobiota bacterium]
MAKWRWWLPLWLAVLSGWTARGAARDPAEVRLRRLVELPPVAFQLTLRVDLRHGWVFTGDDWLAARQRDRLQKELDAGAADPMAWARLAGLSDLAGEKAAFHLALSRALAAFEREGIRQSRDDARVARYAECLLWNGRLEEAASFLRTKTAAIADGWRSRLVYARVLLLQGARAQARRDQAGLDPATLEGQARELADAAVSLVPKEAEAYLGRALVRAGISLARTLRQPPEGTEPAVAVAAATFPGEATPDLRQAARLAPDNPRVWAIRVWHELLGHAFGPGHGGPKSFPANIAWDRLPAELQATVRETLANLHRIGAAGEPPTAALALDAAGGLELFVLRDARRAEETLRRAVALDAGLDRAWEQLTLALIESRRFDELCLVCEARLKSRDTPRTRVMLAKAQDRAGQKLEAFITLSEAREAFPKDPLVNLALSALWLRDALGGGDLNNPAVLLQTAQAGLEKSPPRDLLRNLLFQQGVLLALAGRPDRARQAFERLVQLNPSDDRAREALAVVEEMLNR